MNSRLRIERDLEQMAGFLIPNEALQLPASYHDWRSQGIKALERYSKKAIEVRPSDHGQESQLLANRSLIAWFWPGYDGNGKPKSKIADDENRYLIGIYQSLRGMNASAILLIRYPENMREAIKSAATEDRSVSARYNLDGLVTNYCIGRPRP